MKKFLIIAVLALLAIAFCTIQECKYLKGENQRLEGNQTALLADIEMYKTEAGESAAKIGKLQLTADEFKSKCAALSKEVEQLGIKNKYLENVISTASSTAARIDTTAKDSIVYLPAQGITDTLKCFSYNDGWIKASGCINKENEFTGYFESNDTLLVVAHRIPKRFLFFRFGCKRIEVDITSKNPHTKITHAKWVDFTKK